MKKFIITVNLIAVLTLVPAVIIAYLHTDKPSTEETAKDVNNGQDDMTTLKMVKSF